MSEVPIRAKVRSEHPVSQRKHLTMSQLRKKERMRTPQKKSFFSRFARRLEPNPNEDARYNSMPVLTVTEAGPAELEARRPNIVPGRVIQRNEHAVEPGQRGIEPPQSNPSPYNVINNHLASSNTTRGNQTEDRRIRQTSTTSIRELRGLIRDKYRRDVYVWSKRGVQVAMRPVILAEAKRSDALLSTILAIVKTWDRDSFGPEEWQLARKIKMNLIESEGRYVLWKDSPPWDPKRLEMGEEIEDES